MIRFRNVPSLALAAVLSTAAAASFVTLAPALQAQTTSGNIVGTVHDSSGAVVPNASVAIVNAQTGVVSKTTSNQSGQYQVLNLLPGTYNVTSTANGFQVSKIAGVSVTLNTSSTADVTLAVGNTTTVEVQADAGAVLDTTSQNLTVTLTNQQLSTLPNASIGEGVINESLLAPGVASTGGIGIGTGPSIAGQRPRNNNFEIEGIDNNNKSVTGPLVYVPNDAVTDFTLITTQFSPEFGHSSGGQFNTNVISGTNKLHGRLYEYFQNRNLNAASGIAGGKIPNPRYDNNRYGGQVGGPIIKDKAFFFVNYERNTVGQSNSYFLCTPTAGALSTLTSLASAYGFNANNLAQYEKYVPAANVTGLGGAGIDATNDNACGNEASGAQYYTVTDAAGAASTSIPLGNYLVNAPVFSNADALAVSGDYNISPKDSFRLRYVYNTLGSQDTAASLPVFFTSIPTKNHLVALSEYHNFTPSLTNEFRVGYNRYYSVLGAGNFAFPGLDSFPNLTFYDEGYINVGPDGNAPQFTIQNLYQATDNVSYTRGHHTIKLGFDGRKYISPQFFIQRARGDYQWSNTSDYLHDLAPDSSGFGERSVGASDYYGDQTAFYGYGNDTYRATSHLTLNFGLRYEFTAVPVGERTQSLNAIASVPGLITFSKPTPARTAFAPRFGVEYAPDEKTSIRAGFGMAYDVLFDNLGTLSTPPELNRTTDVGTGAGPAFSSPNFLANGGLPSGGTAVFTTQAAAAAVTSAYIPNQVLPYTESYTLTVQRNLGSGLIAEIGYIGTRGIHLPTQIQYNIQPRVNGNNNLFTTAGGAVLEAAGAGATNLAAIQALSNILPAFAAANFTSKITSYQPYSGSSYNGAIANLQGRMKNGLQVNLAYTYSKAMDDATAEVFATVLTPRRPQNSQNLNADYSRSALDRTHRVTLESDYDFQAFKGKNWLLHNVVANWTFSPIYTYESPEYATVLSGDNANLNGDSGAAIDRAIINPNGVKGTGSAVKAVKDANGNTIGYTALNPNAYYIQAGPGTLPNSSRNTLPLPPENNLDFAAYKRFTAFEHYSIEVGAQAFNVLNHAQYIPGSVDNVAAIGYTSSYNLQTVTSAFFNHPDKEFSNNARSMQLSAKFLF